MAAPLLTLSKSIDRLEIAQTPEFDTADVYIVLENVLACLYRPEPDMRLPLFVSGAPGWALSTWTILPQAVAGSPAYLLLLASNSGTPAPNNVVVESQFGARQLALRPPRGLGQAPFEIMAFAASACLRAIAARRLADELGLISAIAQYVVTGGAEHGPARMRGMGKFSAPFAVLPAAIFLLAKQSLSQLRMSNLNVNPDGEIEVGFEPEHNNGLAAGSTLISVSAFGEVEIFKIEASVS